MNIFLSEKLMETQERAFLENYRGYNALKKTHLVPNKIAAKLDYLARAILNYDQPAQQVKELMELDEIDALDTLDHHTKLKLFVSISDCLLGRDTPTEAVQGYIREGKYISLWQLCYVSYDAEHLYITTHQRASYRLAELKAARSLQRKSDRYIISIEMEKGQLVQLSFEREGYANKLHRLLSDKEQRTRINNLTCLGPSLTENTMVLGSTIAPKRRFGREQEVEEPTQIKHASSTHQVTTSISSATQPVEPEQQRQLGMLSSLQKQIIEQFSLNDIMDDYRFRIIEVMRNGRILKQEDREGVCRLCMTLESNNTHNILSALSLVKNWNCEIEESKIVSRVQPNSYIYYERLKSHGITSRRRDFVFLRQGIEIGKRVFLLDRSVEHENYPPLSRIARGIIKQRITALVPHHENNKLTLMVVQMQAEFGGYSSKQESLHQSVRFLKGYAALNQYLDQPITRQLADMLYNFQPAPTAELEKSQQGRRLAIIEQSPKGKAEQPLRSLDNLDKLERMCQSDIKQAGESISKTALDLKLWNGELGEESIEKPTKQVVPEQKRELSQHMTRFEWEVPTEDFLELVCRLQQNHSHCLKHAGGLEPLTEATPRYNNQPGLDNFIFQNGDWKLNEHSEFVFINQKVINSQKDVIKWVIKKIGTNFISGKSIMNMSLPVDVFDKRGLLERNAVSLGYAPIYLQQASAEQNLLEQMKLVICYLLSVNTLQLRSEKPFNPILGETFQGYIGTTPVCYEQISHHPPISAYYMKNEDYELYGNLVSFAQMGLNSAAGGNAGIIHVKFPKNGTHYECSLPAIELTGLVFGDRKFRPIGKGFVLNRQNLMFTEIAFGKEKKGLYQSATKMRTGDIAGGIYTVTEDFIKKYVKTTGKYKSDGMYTKDMIQKHCEISGAWNNDVFFDGKLYKGLLDPAPYQVEYQKVPLPSNSNYREDIIHLRMGNLAKSQQAKQQMEDRQRADKKLRGTK